MAMTRNENTPGQNDPDLWNVNLDMSHVLPRQNVLYHRSNDPSRHLLPVVIGIDEAEKLCKSLRRLCSRKGV